MEVVGEAALNESPEPEGDIEDEDDMEEEEIRSRRKNPALASSKWTSRPWQPPGK